MSRVYLLVEGQTEEAFVNELLGPHYARLGLYLIPIIVSTSPGYKGGVVSYAKIKPQIDKLCKQDAGAHVTTLFDLYALPGDFPGKSSPAYPSTGNGQRKAEFLEAELAKDIAQRNFIPNLLVHEFEALLFVQIDAFEQQARDDVRVAMITQLHHDPAAAHLVRHCTGCAGTGERVKNQVAWVSGNFKNSANQLLGFRSSKPHVFSPLRKQLTLLVLSLTIVSSLLKISP